MRMIEIPEPGNEGDEARDGGRDPALDHQRVGQAAHNA